MRAHEQCSIRGCDNLAGRSGYCKNCRSSWYYWKKKNPAYILVRRSKLQLYQSRLVEMFDEKGKKR